MSIKVKLMGKRNILIFLLCILSINLVIAIENTDIIAFYNSENTSWSDDTENGHTLTQTGSVTIETGLINNGSGFNGDNGDDLRSSSTDFDLTNDFSLGCWVKPAALQQSGVIGKFGGGGYTAYVKSGGQFEFYAGSGSCIMTTTSTYSGGNWYLMVVVVDSGQGLLYFNNNSQGSDSTCSWANSANTFQIGNRADANLPFNGVIDNCFVFDRVLSQSDINDLYNGGSGLGYPFSVPTPPVTNFTISSNLNNFTVIINGSDYNAELSTTTGSLITGIQDNSTTEYNITGLSEGFFTEQYFNYVPSLNGTNLSIVFLHGQGFHVEYSNNITYNNTDYVRNLSIELHFDHCPSNNTAYMYIDGVLNNTYYLNCDNTSDQYIYTDYVHNTEGKYNISWLGNIITELDNINFSLNNSNFTSDLYNPYITNISINIPKGFEQNQLNVTYSCNDNITPILTYNATFNLANILYQNITKNTLITNTSLNINDSINTLRFMCSDFFNSVNDSKESTIYKKTLALIDEIDNSPFNVSNVTSAKVYFDDNSSVFDFKGNSTSKINFTSANETKLRFELTYSDGTVITRWVDITLLNEDVRVCANKEGVTHYEQLIIASSSARAAILENVYSNCVVAADYTRFAYQDALVLKAFTIASLYSIYTNDRVLLASVDGSISSYINLDTLEFTQSAVDIDILGDALTFQKNGTDQIKIYYNNIQDDNTDLSLSITRLDTNTVVYTKSDFEDPNEFILYFNYATLNNVTEDTIFQIQLIKINGIGEQIIKRYFNNAAKTGLINSVVAAILSVVLILAGLSLTITRTAFSWFGIIISVIAIALLSASIYTWYIVVLMAVEVIILVYIFLNLVYQTYPEVS